MDYGVARFDLAVVGAGIVGLATALAAVRRGLSVVVIDRDAQANGASIRNFGFVTISGQSPAMWQRARRSCAIWREVATAARIPILQEGAWVIVRRPESVAILEAFVASAMGTGCRLLSAAEARRRCAQIVPAGTAAVLESSLELRVESREAIPRLAAWLESLGVTFMRSTSVTRIEPPRLHTSRAQILAERIAVCPGDDFHTLYPERIAAQALTRCKLQMLRLAAPGFTVPAALMSDLGLARYAGFAELPCAAALKARLAREQPRQLAAGVHLIVVQSADGTLVVGDSHEYAPTPDPFASAAVEELILEEFRAALGVEPPAVLERWTGTYASAADRAVLIDAPDPQVRLVIVTSGAGASTGFAIGEEVIGSFLEGVTP
jgi:D-hydroxyproline dehydrogenase subunit beta